MPTTERSKVQCLLFLVVKSNRKETIKKSASRNTRFIPVAISVVKSTHLNPQSCKFSKKIYTRPRLLVLILFKDFRNPHHREFIEDAGDQKSVEDILDLSGVPHFPLLQKFLSRVKSVSLRLRFRKTGNLLFTRDDIIPLTAIGSSGFSSGYCSYYFLNELVKFKNIS